MAKRQTALPVPAASATNPMRATIHLSNGQTVLTKIPHGQLLGQIGDNLDTPFTVEVDDGLVCARRYMQVDPNLIDRLT